ncbi:hypothetical protein [Pseudotamlana carrageenivorans]|uniref:Uncharacterized protein n=1 Tax=Pseudotamlana carrageenivorans TaxID=2069432 RepID=A0A2I7SF11_9FLAO|nr:hypothetical protein [Tamlana carrageenivorans]AUS04489.1 hypothetical protein C1A40_02930 [Tamlana carrageenivorans]
MSTDKSVFKQHPHLKSYHETADGTKFFKPEHAKLHAKSLKDKAIKEVKRPVLESVEVVLEELTPMQKAKLRVRDIKKLDTVEAVKAALEGETAKTVIEAGEQRIRAIQDVDGVLNTSVNEEE